MQHASQRHQTATSQPASQREEQPRSGSLSVQLAQSPRQLAQRHQLQDLRSGPVQRAEGLEEEDEAGTVQLLADPAQHQENRTGMPDGLKAGIESLSGMDMSDVRVHRNSSQPAQLNALAYAQGKDIHLGPGQEQHLPHEAWHVVQQRQGRVQATMQMAGVGVGVNDDEGLEREADVMGARAEAGAAQLAGGGHRLDLSGAAWGMVPYQAVAQRKVGFEFQMLNTSVGLMDEADLPTVDPETQRPSKVSFSTYPKATLDLTNRPKFIVDGMSWKNGANAEYATRVQYDNPALAKSDVEEIAAHATTNIVKNKASDIGGKKLFVWRCDSSNGQPQMNIDVAFENVGKEEGIRKGDDKKVVTSKDDFIGVTKKNMWKLEETDAFLKIRALAKATLDQMDLQGVAAFVTLPAADAVPEGKQELHGLTTLISATKVAVMAYVSGMIPAGSSELSKDLAILPKVKLPELFLSVEATLRKSNGDTLALDQSGILGFVVARGDEILNLLVPFKDRDSNVKMSGGTGLPKQIKGASTVTPDMVRETVVMEYRRAKILPVNEWAGFAGRAVAAFNQLDEPV